MSTVWGERQDERCKDERHKEQKKVVDTFWENPDARLLLVANYLHALETTPAGPLTLRTTGFQYRIIRQAEEYMRVYEKVQQILVAP